MMNVVRYKKIPVDTGTHSQMHYRLMYGTVNSNGISRNPSYIRTDIFNSLKFLNLSFEDCIGRVEKTYLFIKHLKRQCFNLN